MKVGDRAPDFELADQTGATLGLGQILANGPAVVYFFPAAMTPGCTREACHFRDLTAEFEALGAQRVGISPDEVGKQKLFDERYSLGFPLLSDPERSVAAAYGVKRGLGITPVKRTTFVIDRNGVIQGVIKSELNMSVHADKALQVLRELQPEH